MKWLVILGQLRSFPKAGNRRLLPIFIFKNSINSFGRSLFFKEYHHAKNRAAYRVYLYEKLPALWNRELHLTAWTVIPHRTRHSREIAQLLSIYEINQTASNLSGHRNIYTLRKKKPSARLCSYLLRRKASYNGKWKYLVLWGSDKKRKRKYPKRIKPVVRAKRPTSSVYSIHRKHTHNHLYRKYILFTS